MATNNRPPDDPGGTTEDGNIITDRKLEELVSNAVTEGRSSGSTANTMTSPWGVDGQVCNKRSYKQIIEESKKDIENVLCIRIEKLKNNENNDTAGQKITNQDIENIIFDELNVDVDQIEEIDFSKFNTKEIHFKRCHDVDRYCRNPSWATIHFQAVIQK